MFLQKRLLHLAIALALCLFYASCSKNDKGLKNARVVYEEDFNGNSGWLTGNFKNGYRVSEIGGKYVHYLNTVDGFYYYTNRSNTIFMGTEKKQVVEYTVRIQSGRGGVNIMLNINDSNEVIISLSQNQHFNIAKYTRGKNREEIVDWTQNSNINLSQMSVVKAELESGVLTIYINENKLHTWSNSGINTLDKIGVGISVWKGSEATTIEVDKIRALVVD